METSLSGAAGRGRAPCAVILLVVLCCWALAACDSGPRTPTSPSPQGLRLTCPPDVNAPATSSSGATVTFSATTQGAVSPFVISCTPNSGSLFPTGTTNVQCTATDAESHVASCTFRVVVTPPAARLAATRFLAFGDSVTAGEISQATARAGAAIHPLELRPELSYPTRLREQLATRYPAQAPEIAVTNAGRSGEYAADAVSRFAQVIREQPAGVVVLLLHGYNDLVRGPGGSAAGAAGLESMVKEARFRGARVFLATLTPPRPGGSRTMSASDIDRFNEQVRSMARGEGAVLVDLHAALSPDVERFIGPDGLHPTEAGYRRMAETFLEAIAGELEQR